MIAERRPRSSQLIQSRRVDAWIVVANIRPPLVVAQDDDNIRIRFLSQRRTAENEQNEQ